MKKPLTLLALLCLGASGYLSIPVYPGQACSYMIGQLKLVDLREKAKSALGSVLIWGIGLLLLGQLRPVVASGMALELLTQRRSSQKAQFALAAAWEGQW